MQTSTSSSSSCRVLVVGAGIVGCAVAHELASMSSSVVAVDMAATVCSGASCGNSGLVHTGFDSPERSLELELVREGYSKFMSVAQKWTIRHSRCGAVVVAWTEGDAACLPDLVAKAHRNGVTDVRLIEPTELYRLEPTLAPGALGGVHVPGESYVDAGAYGSQLARSFIEHGGQLCLNSKVVSLARVEVDASGNKTANGIWRVEIETVSPSAAGSANRHRWELFADTVVNCGGLHGDTLDKLGGKQPSFAITPRKGEFVVLEARGSASCALKTIVLPVPSARTKGVLAFPSVNGQIVVGPTAQDQTDRFKAELSLSTGRALMNKGREMVPSIRECRPVGMYAGLRPAADITTYVIENDAQRGWITVGNIRSTGLTASLGIGAYVGRLYQARVPTADGQGGVGPGASRRQKRAAAIAAAGGNASHQATQTCTLPANVKAATSDDIVDVHYLTTLAAAAPEIAQRNALLFRDGDDSMALSTSSASAPRSRL